MIQLCKEVPMYAHPTFLAMSGIIGAGKTTLAEDLARRMNYDIYHELGPDQSNLREFYADKSKHAFALQVEMLANRFAQHQQIVYSGRNAIVDRSIYEDMVFALVLHSEGHMTLRQYGVYLKLAEVMRNAMRKPTAIVHLDVEPEEALRRIRLRNREYERGITLQYLCDLRDCYEVLLTTLSKDITIVRIPWDRVDRNIDLQRVEDAIKRTLSEVSFMRQVSIQ